VARWRHNQQFHRLRDGTLSCVIAHHPAAAPFEQSCPSQHLRKPSQIHPHWAGNQHGLMGVDILGKVGVTRFALTAGLGGKPGLGKKY